MRQQKLETLVWLARLKSFRAVAEKLNTTQAAISQRVASVENQLGVTLFERRKRNCKLTAEGREIIPYAERILELTSEMLNRVANVDAFRGVIRLGVVDTIVHVWLTTLLEHLQKHHPHVTVELRVDTSSVLREAVQSGSLDMAFLVGPLVDADMTARYLCSYEFAWVANAGMNLQNRLVGIEELSSKPIVTFPKSSRPYAIVKEQLKAANLQAARINASGSVTASINLVANAGGIGFLPVVSIREELAQGRLHMIETEALSADLQYFAYYPSDLPHALTEAIVDLAKEVAAVNSNELVS
ncbi:LysR family transcriptional regulator [Roseibium aggregatum]|uniref:LysR family transcriptional regulator n=1 Tax=Roseibium aggregatum TaxID=187304 RepID=A0A939J1G0_9HYPH|nr:LysR family transcriptional regulator [Roseibium aggregatum]MBN9672101.1 LysR family transcriptional regulator [Roseibium aggregatum]